MLMASTYGQIITEDLSNESHSRRLSSSRFSRRTSCACRRHPFFDIFKFLTNDTHPPDCSAQTMNKWASGHWDLWRGFFARANCIFLGACILSTGDVVFHKFYAKLFERKYLIFFTILILSFLGCLLRNVFLAGLPSIQQPLIRGWYQMLQCQQVLWVCADHNGGRWHFGENIPNRVLPSRLLWLHHWRRRCRLRNFASCFWGNGWMAEGI